MALLNLTEPPEIPGAKYEDYRQWLEANHFDRLCCYCLLHQPSLQIEHFVPKEYPAAEHLKHDPSNLLLACAKCNRSKSDYHPEHQGRRRQANATHGYEVIDPRTEEYSSFLEVRADGHVEAVDGDPGGRGAWHIGLTMLDFGARNRDRMELLRLRDAAEVVLLDEGQQEEIRNLVLDNFADRILFYELFQLPVSDGLMSEAKSRRESRKQVAL